MGWEVAGRPIGPAGDARQGWPGTLACMSLGSFELGMLRRPRGATAYDEETLERIQAEHLAFHAQLRAEGTIVTNGPLRGQPDESLRGFTFYRVGSLARARGVAGRDAAVGA